MVTAGAGAEGVVPLSSPTADYDDWEDSEFNSTVRRPGSVGTIQRLVRLYQIGHHPHQWQGRNEALVVTTLGEKIADPVAWRKYISSINAVDSMDGKDVGDVSFGPGGEVGITTVSGDLHCFRSGWKAEHRKVDGKKMAVFTTKTTAILTQKGDVYTKGVGPCLGHGNDSFDLSEPKLVNTFYRVNVSSIAAGANHCLAVSVAGAVFSWGHNDHGQLGLGTASPDPVSKPMMISSLGGFVTVKISCGVSHSGLVDSAGRVYTWGCGQYGRLGHGEGRDVHEPMKVKFLEDVVCAEVACGFFHTLALTNGGAVLGWGLNDYGQVGSGSRSEWVESPLKVSGVEGLILTIAAGGYHSAAISEQGQLYMWGSALCGQCGDQNERYLEANMYGEEKSCSYRALQVKVLTSRHLQRVYCGPHTIFVVEREPREWHWRSSQLDLPESENFSSNMLGFALRRLLGGNTMLKYGRKGKPHTRYFNLSSDFQYICWQSSRKKPARSRVPLSKVVEIRLGQRTPIFSRFEPEEGQQKLSFSIIYHDDKGAERSLDVVCADEGVFRAWVVGLDTVRSATTSDPLSQLLRREFDNAAALHGGVGVRHSDVSRFVQRLCENVSPDFLNRRLHEHGARLRMNHEVWTWQEVLDFTNGLRFSDILREVFDERSMGKPYLSREEVLSFVRDVQRDETVTTEDVDRLIRKHERSQEAVCMHFGGFAHYIRSRANSVRNVRENSVHEDMTLPLTDYFVSSYRPMAMPGSTPPTLQAYRTVLESGCRCLDVVLVDGPQGIPRVLPHGAKYSAGGMTGINAGESTLESFRKHMVANSDSASSSDDDESELGASVAGIGSEGISAQAFLETVHHHAFVRSPYPLFLSLHVRCTVFQQQMLADILRRELSRQLVDAMTALRVNDMSPEDLRQRIITMVKVSPPETPSTGHGGTDDDSREEGTLGEDSDGDGGNGGLQAVSARGPTKREALVAKSLADIITLRVDDDHDNVYAGVITGTDKVLEVSARTASGLGARNPRSFTIHNRQKLCMVTPSGITGTRQTNVNPMSMWVCGVQFVPLDTSVGGGASWLQRGMFACNGGCGFIPKPAVMRDERLLFDPNTFIQVKTKVRITILEGWQLPDPHRPQQLDSADDKWSSRLSVTQLLSVSVRVRGVSVDCSDKGSQVVESDGHNPIFNTPMEFNIALPELAMVSFVVYNSSPSYRGYNALTPAWGKAVPGAKGRPDVATRHMVSGTGETIGKTANASEARQPAVIERQGEDADVYSGKKGHLLVGHYETVASHLQPGIRSVQLFNAKNQPIPNALLLVRVEII